MAERAEMKQPDHRPTRQPPARAAAEYASTPDAIATLADDRREAVTQRRLVAATALSPRLASQRALMEDIHNSPNVVAQRHRVTSLLAKAAQPAPLQCREGEAGTGPGENPSGLPAPLKAGVESLSGLSMDGVEVHYNSAQPAQLDALAYAQGSEIHVAPGQERHLPHEAWHVVQQAQGRVRPTIHTMGGAAVNDDAVLEREADAMGAKALAATAQPDLSTAIRPARPIAQRAPVPVVSLGITHLVHENDDSIFEGYEVDEIGEVSPGEKLVIDDADIIVSRRGPHAVDDADKQEQYRTGEQIYDWYRVVEVKGVDMLGEKLYLRSQTFLPNKKEEKPLARGHAELGANRVICDPFNEGDELPGTLLETRTTQQVQGYRVDVNGSVETFGRHATLDPPNAAVGQDVTVTEFRSVKEGVLKERIKKEVTEYQVRLDDSDEPGWIAAERVKQAGPQPIKRADKAKITHYTRQAHAHAGEFVKPGGPIDITSHALGSGIYGFHTPTAVTEKYRTELKLESKVVVFDNPFIVQDKPHGTKLIGFGKLLAKTAASIDAGFDESTILTLPMIQKLLLNHPDYAKLTTLLNELLSRAGQPPPHSNALGLTLLAFFQQYRDPGSKYVEQVGTMLFRSLGYGGISGSEETGIDGLTTGNVAFVKDYVNTKIKTRSGKEHTYVT
jgi:Domain of unknown function (DUF4157)